MSMCAGIHPAYDHNYPPSSAVSAEIPGVWFSAAVYLCVCAWVCVCLWDRETGWRWNRDTQTQIDCVSRCARCWCLSASLSDRLALEQRHTDTDRLCVSVRAMRHRAKTHDSMTICARIFFCVLLVCLRTHAQFDVNKVRAHLKDLFIPRLYWVSINTFSLSRIYSY